jgi:hypothetical protein
MMQNSMFEMALKCINNKKIKRYNASYHIPFVIFQAPGEGASKKAKIDGPQVDIKEEARKGLVCSYIFQIKSLDYKYPFICNKRSMLQPWITT